LEKAKAPCDVRRPFVGDDDLGIASLTSGDMGAQDNAGLCLLVLRSGVVIHMDWRRDVPLASLEGCVRCGTACASVAVVVRAMRGRHAVLLPALG
jgi:hypothetical protein